MGRDVAGYLAEIKLDTGRNNTSIDSLVFEWLNDLFEKVETDPQKVWFLDKTVRFTIKKNFGVYEVPQDFQDEYKLHIVDLALNSYRRILPIDVDEAKKRFGPSDTGEPERYSLTGKSFVFWPRLPDENFLVELTYKSFLPRVSVNVQINEFMINHHSLLKDGLRAQLWEHLGQEDRATYYWAKWGNGWLDLKANNVSRALAGEIALNPRTDVNASIEDDRQGFFEDFGGR